MLQIIGECKYKIKTFEVLDCNPPTDLLRLWLEFVRRGHYFIYYIRWYHTFKYHKQIRIPPYYL